MANEDDRGPYDVAAEQDRLRPAPKDASSPPAPLPPESVPTLPYATRKESGLDPDVLINRQIPVILVGAGLAIRFIYAWWAAPSSRLLPNVFGEVGLSLMLSTGLALVCVFAASYIRGFKMGSLGEAVLKLMAVSIAPSAAMLLLSVPLHFIPFGVLGVWGIGFCLYFALLGLFFDLDQEDTWLCVILIGVVNIFVTLAVRFSQ